MRFLSVIGVRVKPIADVPIFLPGQLDGNGQKGMIQIDALAVENFWLRH